MKYLLAIVLLVTPAMAVPGWLIGFSVGVTVQIIPFTRNHIIMPPMHKLQKIIRPVPQDKIDKEAHRAAKARKARAQGKSQDAQPVEVRH